MSAGKRHGPAPRLLAVAAVLLLAAAALARPGRGGWMRMIYGDPRWEQWDGTVVFLGDSITDFCDLERFYPGLKAVNSGIAGDTTSGILERMEGSVYAHNPQVVVLLAGINDLLSGVPERTVIQNLLSIVADIHERLPAAKVIVQSIYPVCPWYDMGDTAERIRTVNRALETSAAERDYRYVDLFDRLKAADGDWLDERYSDDGLHPNDAGYQAVQPALTDALNDAISQLVYG